MRRNLRLILVSIKRPCLVSLLALVALATVYGQSTNIDYPTPVLVNDVSGMIVARDLGDSRLTRHYYLLTGTPGDLLISVDSNNLNGDVDLFTSGDLRPLTKLTMYAGLSATATTRSVFLRRRESLLVRVEARSANDDPGSYRIQFAGSFEPVADVTPALEPTEPEVRTQATKNRKVRRVNAVGARMKEEEPETVATTTEPEPQPASPTGKVMSEAEKTNTVPEATSAESNPSTPATPRRTRPPRKARRPPTTTAKKKVETTAPAAVEPPPAEPVLNPRLIIETRDGMRVERYMSEVRRFTVERGQLIVVTNDGRVERRPMSTVLRVTIEP